MPTDLATSDLGLRRVTEACRSSLVFEVRDEGPLDAPAVLLLHGFPQSLDCWEQVTPLLLEAGLRVVAPAQRGDTPGARPTGRSAYKVEELVDDAVAVLDAAGVERAHVVGHDWGGAVAWHLAGNRSERVASLTALSTPHPRAMLEATWRSTQLLQSSYVAAFQVPALPEMMLLARGGAPLRWALERSGLPARYAERYVRAMLEPGALRAALAWYRAIRPGATDGVGPVEVPAVYLWSSDDPALSRAAAERTGRHVSGPYRFEVAEGIPHWLPEVVPEQVAELVTRQVEDTEP